MKRTPKAAPGVSQKKKIQHKVGDQIRALERQAGGPDTAFTPHLDPRDAQALANIPQSQIIENTDGDPGTNID